MVNSVELAELVIFAILVIPSLYCVIQHLPLGIIGWTYVFIFCTLRIIGSVLVNWGNGDGAGSIVASVGLSPLLLAATGIIHEARRYCEPYSDIRIEFLILLVLHVVVGTGVAILAVGIAGLESSDPSSSDIGLTRGGGALLTVAWVLLLIWLGFSFFRNSRNTGITHPLYRDGNTLLLTVAAAMIFIGVRVIYSLVALGSDKAYLSPINGSLAIRILLELLPDVLTALILLTGGIVTRHVREHGAVQAPPPRGPMVPPFKQEDREEYRTDLGTRR